MKNKEWGGLQHHYSECPSKDEHDDGWCPEGCDGEQIFWGSFYTQDESECECCHKVKGVAEFGAWVCVDCYMVDHKNTCGCDLWEGVK